MQRNLTPHSFRHAWYQVVVSCYVVKIVKLACYSALAHLSAQTSAVGRVVRPSGTQPWPASRPDSGPVQAFHGRLRWEGWSDPRTPNPGRPPDLIRGLSRLSTAIVASSCDFSITSCC
jgi:hypothetical protein